MKQRPCWKAVILQIPYKNGEGILSCNRKRETKACKVWRFLYSSAQCKQTCPRLCKRVGKYGVPAWADTHNGFFVPWKVAVMLSLLRVIDNPLQDISFASVFDESHLRIYGGRYGAKCVGMKETAVIFGV